MKKEEDITEEPKDNIKASIDISTGDNKDKKGPSYKFITKEEVEYLKKKFAEEDKKTKYDRKGGQVSKKEFDEAIEEMLNMKKGKKETPKEDKSKKKIMGLTQKFEDEEEFEEYELPDDDEDEEYKKAIEQVENRNYGIDRFKKNLYRYVVIISKEQKQVIKTFELPSIEL